MRLNLPAFVATLVLLAGAARADAPVFLARPYLTDPSPTTITVRAVTRRACTPALSIAGRRPIVGPRGTVHALLVTGLAPGEDVPFVLEACGATQRSVLRPLPSVERDEARLLVVGDNRDGNGVLEVFAGRARRNLPDAVLHLGDMVPTGRDDAEWLSFLAAANPALARRPMLAVLGNHELAFPGGRTRFGRFARRLGSRTPSLAAYAVGPLEVVILDSNDPASFATTQLAFLTHAVQAARARGASHVVVALHHGPYSSGYHSNLHPLHTSGLVRAFKALGVSLVLAGHDHVYERGVGAVPYVLSGGAGSPLYVADRRLAQSLAFAPEHHMITLTATRDSILLVAERLDGSVLERCELRSRRFLCPKGARTGVSNFDMWAMPRLVEGAVLLAVLLIASLWGLRSGTFRPVARTRHDA